MKSFRIRSILSLCTLYILLSCGKSDALQFLYQTKAFYTDYVAKSKRMRFVKMHHIGKPEFYSDVVNTVKTAKKDGYVLFYEWIDFDTATDLEKRKLRKLLGFIPSPEGYKTLIDQLGDESLVVQDNQLFLNLENSNDYVVDLTPQEVLSQYENKYGKLILTQHDLDTPLSEYIKVTLPQEQVDDALLHFRNKHLAETIHNSSYSKIVVLYGEAHETGLFKLLKSLDINWIKKKE